MKYLRLPPFLVARVDSVVVARGVATNQVQGACAAVFVCRDLAHQKDLVHISVQSALHDTMFWKFQLVYGNEILTAPVVLIQRHALVALERGDQVFSLVSGVLEVLPRG